MARKKVKNDNDKSGGTPEPVEGMCGAKLRKSEEKYGEPRYCALLPIAGRSRCRFHGGKSPAGVKSPSFKHGKFSSYLPTSLAEKAEELAQDERHLELKSQMIEARARQIQLFERLNSKDPSTGFRIVQDAYRKFKKAWVTGEDGPIESALQEMDRAFDASYDDSLIWDEVVRLQDHNRKLVDTERKYLRDNEGMIPISYAVSVIESLFGIVVRAVRQGDAPLSVLETIQNEYSEKLSGLKIN